MRNMKRTQLRLKKSISINELNLSIAGKDEVLQLGFRECIRPNLQKRCWNENHLDRLIGPMKEILNRSYNGMARENHIFQMGCERVDVAKFLTNCGD